MTQKMMYFSGTELTCSLQFPETAGYLKSVITEKCSETVSAPPVVSVKQEEFSAWKKAGNPIDAFAEFCLMCMPVSEALLSHNKCIFHAAALSCRGKAWLIAAGSGTGKSTLCRTLMERWPEEITVINGDKPILQLCDDDSVIVHPSPWNGKEGWHGAKSAPLAGIFLLQRGDQNMIEPATDMLKSMKVFQGIFQSFENKVMIQNAAAMAERIIQNTSVWRLISKEASESAPLLYERMNQEE